jgi:putative ABC transport system permease protein
VKHLFVLAVKSAWNRRLTLGLTGVAIALSTLLLIGIEQLREDARRSFAQSVAGVDLVVGARGSPVQLMLYAVFRIGEGASGMRWDSAQMLQKQQAVAWTVPVALGDSHRGFAVLGTTTDYFERLRYGDGRALVIAQGRPFGGTVDTVFDAVLGAEVAERLGYKLGDRITLAHGTGDIALAEHADKPFTVVGVLARTGTPVDRTVHISLQGIEAIHLDWAAGAPMPGLAIPPEFVRKFDLTPKNVTAVFVGLKSRAAVFSVQRAVTAYADEPLMAVLPGVALDELWQLLGTAERALLLVSALVAAVSLAGLVAVILAGLNERRRELAILRSVGARPLDICFLLMLEGVVVTLIGVAVGLALVYGLSVALGPLVETRYGVLLVAGWPRPTELAILAAILVTGAIASLIPGLRAYRLALADGLTPRV